MENIIKVSSLTKKFNNFVAVDSISFDVKKGEIFGFLGPNGAGKSTTIRMLTTLLKPTSGSAEVASFDIIKEPDEVRKHIGLVAEKIILYNHLTATENLKFFGSLNHVPVKTIKERAQKWLKRLGMEQWENKQADTYSTGMKQRVNIVRALITEPEILILDEPTLGLDPQTTHLIRTFIRELNNQGITIILTTHDMIEADALCDRIAIIDHGKIVALDTVSNLKKTVKDKAHPTMEDVFLAITGFGIRDETLRKAPLSGRGHGPFGGGGQKRVR